MVTIAEAQAQVKTAKEELKGARTQAQKREAEIKLAEAQSIQRRQKQARVGKIESQVSLARQVGRGRVRGEIKRRRVVARKEFVARGKQISGAEQELAGFRKQLVGRELEIAGVEKQISAAQIQQQRAEQLRLAKEAFLDIRSGAVLSGIPKDIQEQARREVRDIKEGLEVRSFFSGVEKIKQELLPGQTISSVDLRKKTLVIETEQLKEVPTKRKEFTFKPQTVTRLGGVILKRTELEELKQQSLPPGTIGVIPQEQVRNLGAITSLNIVAEKFLTDIGVPKTIRGVQENLISKISSPIIKEKLTERLKVRKETFLGGVGSGIFKFVREEPVTIGLISAGGFVLGGGLKLLGAGAKILSRVSGFKRVPTILSSLELQAGIGLLSVAGTKFASDILFAPTPEAKGEVVGRETITLSSFVTGARLGGKVTERTISGLKTRNLEFIPLEDISVLEPFAQAPRGTTAEQLAKQFREQRVVTAGGIDKFIRLPGEIKGEGINVFTASLSGPRGERFAALLGESREPGPFFAPQLSKEFLGRGGPQETFFGLDTSTVVQEPIAFRIRLKDIGRLPENLLSDVRQEGLFGFKGFASPSQQRIVSFRAEQQDPFKALISTRFEVGGGEIEAIGRAGAVFERFNKPFFTELPSGQKVLIERFAPTGEIVEPLDLFKRVRGTAIVKTPKGIVLTFAPEEKAFILPGGGVDVGESIAKATARELFEETGLKALKLNALGSIEGPIKRFGKRRKGKDPFRFVRETFEVFKVDTQGRARPRGEIKNIAFLGPDFTGKISQTTKEILKLAGEDIGEFKVKTQKTNIKQKDLSGGKFTIEDLSRISSESFGISRRGIITPLRFGASSIIRKKRKGKGRTFIGRKTPPAISGEIFKIPSPDISRPPSPPPTRRRVDITPLGTFPSLGPFDFGFEEPLRERRRGKRKRTAERKLSKRRGGFQFGFDIKLAPSFTGILTGGRGAAQTFKVGTKDLGVLPSNLRGLETGSPRSIR